MCLFYLTNPGEGTIINTGLIIQNQCFVQFRAVPYADIDVPRFLGFGMHMSAFIFAVVALGKKFFPSWYSELMNEGSKRFFRKSHYLPLRLALGVRSVSDFKDVISCEVA